MTLEALAAAVAPTVLVVDDEKNIRRTLDMVLSGDGYRVVEAASAEEALALLARPSAPVDLCIFDVKLPGISGLEALERLRKDDATRDLPVIVISGHATVHDAVYAIKLGASDFFEKPLNRERVLVSVRNVLKAANLARTVQDLRGELEARYEMIGTSAVMQRLFAAVDKVAPTRASVLITGESGTGKELISRAIHRLSPRVERPFIKVNCAAIPRELIESELFGHERGAFTGAQQKKRGLFEQAHGGTIFLDEIGDMELTAQAKVLRALQNGEIARVGSESVQHVDVRVLAATNKDLEAEVAAGRFREDLYFRLNVFPLRSPSLRERVEDVPLLADAFMVGFAKENGLRPKPIDPMVYKALQLRQWPGNVRELKNVVERAAILSGDQVTIADLPEDPHENPFDDEHSTADEPEPLDEKFTPLPPPAAPGAPRLSLKDYRDAAERHYITETLRSLEWNISRAAIALGVERTNLHKKIRAYGIRRESLVFLGFDSAPPRGSIAAGTAGRFVELTDHLPRRLAHLGHDQLRDALAATHDEGLLAVVDEQHRQLAAVVGVDRPRGIQHGEAMTQREPAAGADLGFEAHRQRDREPGGDQRALPGQQRHVRADGGAQVHAGGVFGLVAGHGERIVAECFAEQDEAHGDHGSRSSHRVGCDRIDQSVAKRPD
jgi:two-component system, NtrC family, nitrogen regulation response regulator NtrX